MRIQRVEIGLFALAWISYAYFHQGGGWNQNGRFAMTRALVESQRPWIDDYLVYVSDGPKGSPKLRRLPVRDGVFTADGRSLALAWTDGRGELTPLAATAPRDAMLVHVDVAGASSDLAFARGHVHPNKAPGTSFAAAPGYAIVRSVEWLLGVDADAARVLNVNAWLSGASSVGLFAALGVVLFRRAALKLSDGRNDAALFSTLAFSFGTLYFPYATMLYEHDLVAVALLGAYLLASGTLSPARLFGAGLCAGAAVLTSYLSVVAAAILLAYVAWRARRLAALAAFAAGTLPAVGLLAAYNLVCFGQLWTTNYAWENPLFNQSGGLLELFGAPRWDVLIALLVSPARGLFAGTPVLVLGVVGLIVMLRRPKLKVDALLFGAMIVHVLLFNASFKAWHGGWTCGPRYLIPAIPFLALPIAVLTPRLAWVRHALLAVSIAAMALATSVDPQPPAPLSPPWRVSPVWSIDFPQFLDGRPGSFASAHWTDSELARYVEPVSANPSGIYGAPEGLFEIGSPELRWSSFNVGEFLFPGSRLSLLPWLLLAACLAGVDRLRRKTATKE